MAENILFDAIERGDLEIVQDLLLADDLLEYDAWSSSPDVNAPNENNDTPFALAVKAKDFEMATLLLKCGAAVRSSLLTAVQMGFTPVVRLICEHLKTKKITLKATVDAFGEDKDYLTPTTPLMYAARHNYHDIVKILIEYGAEIPNLEVVLSRTQRDTYEDNQVYLYWHQAVTSEAYLLYATDDPIQATTMAAKLLKQSKKTVLRHRKEECQLLMDNLDRFLTQYVAMSRNGEEIEDLIRRDQLGGTKKTKGSGILPIRIGEVLDLDFKMFISGQACNHFMTEQWYISWRALPAFSFVLWTILVLILQPLLCIIYILLPFKSIRRMIKTPYVRFLVHGVSKFYFIGFILYINAMEQKIVNDEHERYCQLKAWFTSTPEWTQYAFYAWLLGMTIRELKELSKGFKSYWTETFNYADVLQLVLFWASIGLFWKSYVDQNSAHNLNLWNRYIIEMSDGQASCVRGITLESPVLQSVDELNLTRYESVDEAVVASHHAQELFQDQYNMFIISDVLFAIATVLSFLALFRDMTTIAFVGPLRISLGGMITDIIRFFVLFFFVWLSFALGLRHLYQTYDLITTANCPRLGECETTGFNSLSSTLQNLFWSIFNPLDTSMLRVNSDLRFVGDIGEVIYGIYMIVVVVVMLNALIAMMSNTYDRVKEHSNTEWTVERTKLMSSYMTKMATLPPPFNIIPTVRTLIHYLCWPCRRFQSNSKRQKLEEVEMRSTLGRHNRSYQTFIKQITERYANAYFIKPTDDSDDGREATKHMRAEMETLKKSLQTMQTEVMKNQQMLLEILKRRETDGKKASWSIKKNRPASFVLKSP